MRIPQTAVPKEVSASEGYAIGLRARKRIEEVFSLEHDLES